MTIDRLQEQRKRLGYSYAQIAKMSGVPESTVQKVLGGITKSPRISTIVAIENALDTGNDREGIGHRNVAEVSHSIDYNTLSRVPEWAQNSRYPKQGYYTVIDYLNLPDEQKAELIDGVMYDMAAPSFIHQQIVGELYAVLRTGQEHHNECHVCLSPLDVQLNSDNHTMVQPDLFVVCDPDKITKDRIVGAPDLVIEVLSPSTRRKDLQIKLGKYACAGVKEYWMIDPDMQTIIVCVFEDKNIIRMYSFDDTVPVTISGGDVSIDFSKIKRTLFK